MTGPSSLPYWDRRWSNDRTYEASWPDGFARSLELEYLKRHVPATGSILELGCGAFGLSESESLRNQLRGRYTGIDGSPVALEQARTRAERYGGGWEFMQQDLTEAAHLPAADFVLTKRTLQNLTPAARKALWPALAAFPHGLLIEDFCLAREATNKDRARFARERLEIPEFNWPLDPAAEGARLPFETTPFMGWFYALTRVFPNLPRCGFEAGYLLSLEAIKSGTEQPFRGPVVAFAW